ncbi:MAG: type II secretion system protein [Clostridium sp.]|uniref:pilus assembly FimT family protein n=1 Tax=Clostridium sp. TaxID=1506 RepID=UPI0025BC8B81|nr:type II secretion system protein [Clostridium sp.]MCF0149253.1 type II secretion system protein [Clostridium sp.]
MKKGYTLIELIVVLSIITIFSSIVVINIGKVKETMYDIQFKNIEAEIKSLLSFGKAYCRNNNVPGEITIGLDRKTVLFEVTGTKAPIIKRINLGEGIEVLSNINSSGSSKNISAQGYIKSAGKITIKGKNKKSEITISVGSDVIRSTIKNDEEESDIIE